MLAHPAMKRWWEVCTPLQEALATRKPGEWWATMQQVFFTDLWALSNRPEGPTPSASATPTADEGQPNK